MSVAAVVLSHKRRDTLAEVLGRLEALPFDEILVADNASGDGSAELVAAWGGTVRLVHQGENLGASARNLAAEAATSDLLVMLDDDSWPLPGAVEELTALFARRPDLGVAGGFVIDADDEGRTLRAEGVGTFDWFLRGGRRGDPDDGLAAFFFPEGACMVRRSAYLAVGGCFAPYFLTVTEIDLATRMLAAGWDVRYAPRAQFVHAKADGGRPPTARILHLRIRNQLWYFWLRFPAGRAARRIPAYLAFDLIECVRRGAVGAWRSAIVEAWREREQVRAHRAPVRAAVARRAELDRGRLPLRLLASFTLHLAARARRR